MDASFIHEYTRVLCQLGGRGENVIAGDVLKHDSCYNRYIHIIRTLPSDTIFDASEAAFNDTTSLLQKNVIESAVICDMVVVCSLYAATLNKYQVNPDNQFKEFSITSCSEMHLNLFSQPA